MSCWIHCKNFKSNGTVCRKIPVRKHGACDSVRSVINHSANGDTRKVVCSVWWTHAVWSIHYTQLFVYLHRITVSYGAKLYYTSNFHSTVRLNHLLHVCVLVSRDVLYCSTWNFYSVSRNSKLSSSVNLVSFRSLMATYEFRETYFWDDRHSLRLTAVYFWNKIKFIFAGPFGTMSSWATAHFPLCVNWTLEATGTTSQKKCQKFSEGAMQPWGPEVLFITSELIFVCFFFPGFRFPTFLIVYLIKWPKILYSILWIWIHHCTVAPEVFKKSVPYVSSYFIWKILFSPASTPKSKFHLRLWVLFQIPGKLLNSCGQHLVNFISFCSRRLRNFRNFPFCESCSQFLENSLNFCFHHLGNLFSFRSCRHANFCNFPFL